MAHLGPNEREWLVAQVELKKYREKEEREEAEAAAERVAQVLRLFGALLSITLSCMCPGLQVLTDETLGRWRPSWDRRR